MIASPRALTWHSDIELEIDGERFLVTADSDRYMSTESTPTCMVVAKTRGMIDNLLARLAGDQIRNVVDVGIFKGGSTALLAQVLRPHRLTALELGADRVDALDEFLARTGLDCSVRARYGFDQADREALSRMLLEDFGDDPLDLVVDDASHLYDATRVTLEVLFPRLRPGGRYVIEDWAWAHFPGDLWQKGGGYFHDRPALTNLVIELLMLLGSRRDLVAEIRCLPDTVEVIRGERRHDGAMRLEDVYLNRGLTFRPLL